MFVNLPSFLLFGFAFDLEIDVSSRICLQFLRVQQSIVSQKRWNEGCKLCLCNSSSLLLYKYKSMNCSDASDWCEVEKGGGEIK